MLNYSSSVVLEHHSMLESMICSKVLHLYQLLSVSVIPKIQCRDLSRHKGSDMSCEGRGAGLQMQLKIAFVTGLRRLGANMVLFGRRW